MTREVKQTRRRAIESKVFLHFGAMQFVQFFKQVISVRKKTLEKTNAVASRHIRREKANFRLTSISPHVRKFKTGFWIPRPGFRIQGIGFRIPCHRNLDSEIPMVCGIPGILSWISESNAQYFSSTSKNFPDFGFQKQEFLGSRNPDSLTWGDLSLTLGDLSLKRPVHKLSSWFISLTFG